jgi:hypothetical protein
VNRLKFFQHFLSFCWCLVTVNIRHLQLTLHGPLNVSTIQILLSGLKNVLQKPHERVSVTDLLSFGEVLIINMCYFSSLILNGVCGCSI